jgi:hypothetical protein
MCIDVFFFGNDWTEFEIAHLATSTELLNYFLSARMALKKLLNLILFTVFHFVFKIQNIEELLIEENYSYGWKAKECQLGEYYPKDKSFKMCYVEDPFRNCFESQI